MTVRLLRLMVAGVVAIATLAIALEFLQASSAGDGAPLGAELIGIAVLLLGGLLALRIGRGNSGERRWVASRA